MLPLENTSHSMKTQCRRSTLGIIRYKPLTSIEMGYYDKQ